MSTLVQNSGTLVPNSPHFQGSHRFLAEEMLMPCGDKTDGARATMFTNHVTQAMTLCNPEIPNVFTRYENAFGSFTSAVKILPEDATVVSVFTKNAMQKVYALRRADGRLDIHHAAPYRHLAESYGYGLKTEGIDGANAGDVLPAGTVIQSWPSHDAEGNLMMGVNLRTMYVVSPDGQNHEDAFKVSESAARKLTHNSVDKITVVLNANDLPINTMGDSNTHKGFPDVGEMIENSVLLARRRINHETILHDLSASQQTRPGPSDQVFRMSGKVVDIDIFSNLTVEQLDRHPFNRQIADLQRNQESFMTWSEETFAECMADGGTSYTEDVGFWMRQVRLGRTKKWNHQRNEFEGVVLVFTVVDEHSLEEGSKIVNRFAGKGVTSMIVPDDQMPKDSFGRPVEVIVSSLGVANRSNWSQLFEQEMNYIAAFVADQMSRMSADDAEAHLMEFYDIVSPAFAFWIRENVSVDDLTAMVREIQTGEQPIRIESPPFFGTQTLDDIAEAYERFDVKPMAVENIEDGLIVGNNYYFKLRHEPAGKFSARSGGSLSLRGTPSKNTNALKAGTDIHARTPVRVGEQEMGNLMLARNGPELQRMMRMHSTDSTQRRHTIRTLLTRPNPFSGGRIELNSPGMSLPVSGFQSLLKCLGLELRPGFPDDDAVVVPDVTDDDACLVDGIPSEVIVGDDGEPSVEVDTIEEPDEIVDDDPEVATP